MSDLIQLQDRDFSFLGQGSKFRGTLHLSGVTHIASHIEGEVVVNDKSNLCIETSGSLEGKAICHDIEIYGKFKGELKASGKVTLYPPAILEGTLQSESLEVHPGATLNINAHSGKE